MNVKKKTDETNEEITQNSIEKELKMYLAETVEDFDLDPINYWIARNYILNYHKFLFLTFLFLPHLFHLKEDSPLLEGLQNQEQESNLKLFLYY